jgi:hypothetical protein
MRQSARETPEPRETPEHIAEMLREAGGVNRFDQPNFRVVWGWSRLIRMYGEWQKWETYKAALRDKVTGHAEERIFTSLESAIVEARMVPKYLPGNCWHLEMWRPPEEYGSPDQWGKVGEEIVGTMTLDCAGAYPYQGEYELCYPLTSDLTSHGVFVPLETVVVADICNMIKAGRREKFSFLQRRAAIEQEKRREEEGYVRRTMDLLKDGMPAFAGNKFVVLPGGKAK